MKWKKKEREAIEKQIKEYEKKIGNTRCKRKCVFCRTFPECEDCPNWKINEILNMDKVSDNDGCDNMIDFVEDFHLSKVKQFKGFCRNMQQLKFRRQMWEDSLQLTKREFIGKYKSEA